ncbi:MAG: hypothetical protein VX809_04570 [Pseudomonadota bacterium]|nr:hypothetical protein [Pseudomonadota bacterium]
MRKFSVSGDGMRLGNEVKTINCFQQCPRLGKRWYFCAGRIHRSAKRWVSTFARLINLRHYFQQTGEKEKLTGNLPLSLIISRRLCSELLAIVNVFYWQYLIGFKLYFVADIFLQRTIAVVFAPMGPMKAFCASELICPKTIARGRPRKVAIAMLTKNGSLCAA